MTYEKKNVNVVLTKTYTGRSEVKHEMANDVVKLTKKNARLDVYLHSSSTMPIITLYVYCRKRGSMAYKTAIELEFVED